MHFFEYKDRQLYCEGILIREIAEKVGTPFYLYSYHTLVRHFTVFDDAFKGIPHLVCYSAKANSNLALLRLFINLGGGVDVVSGGELYRALKGGAVPQKIVFSGVGKREDEIEYALKTGILMFNVESSQELQVINEVASRIGKKAAIAIRVNPDIDPKTHPYISTGLKQNKFGIDILRAPMAYRLASQLPNLKIVGIDCHIGSQLVEVEPIIEALRRLKQLVENLRKDGMEIQYLDLGGGLGITYEDEEPPHPVEYASTILEELQGFGCTLILEPGRVIVGNAGVLVSKVLYTKENEEKRFVIVDAGMNDLVRPSYYGSYHQILPVKEETREEIVADVVGPICESSDFLAKGRKMAILHSGELIAVMSAGAYGFSMSTNYNSRPRIAEVLVRDDQMFVIRKREGYEDLIRGEKIPDFLIRS
ncbi:MAG: diaminopimelate decarboxylase [Deltaproteobacteria bacterium CG_4_8_14_3_um_filter_45_9]|jgi:diaminopimelate decarboxylase|nr:MAG: diaminopimelate decarboxylase [Deltaproteobacteria bacterium CG03_land_8_20_14_0_80_45_14]PIX21432.1 MAG: diaminopimelate decarboxylase [Deltaproteobacteria bacterium CG_4_8_14_3_um_filter_45_9]